MRSATIQRAAPPEIASAYRPRVAVVTELRGSRLIDAVDAVAEPVVFAAEADLLEALAADRRAFSRVVLPASACSLNLFLAVEAALGPGAIAFLHDKAFESKLTAAAGRKHLFRVLPDAGDPGCAEALQQWIRPRASVRIAPDGVSCSLVLSSGRRLDGDLLNLSAFGLSVHVPHQSMDGALFPGARLAEMAVSRDGEVILDGVDGIVRYCGAHRAEPGYQIGVELVPAPDARSQLFNQRRLVKDRVRLIGYLRNAVGYAEITVRPIHEPELFATSCQGEVDVAADELVLRGNLPGVFHALDTVEVSFDLWGKNYQFASTLLAIADGAFRIRLPRVLIERGGRRVARFRPAGKVHMAAQLQSPLPAIAPIDAEIVNITTAGCCVEYDSRESVFPLGTIVPGVTLKFPDASLYIGSARVRSTERRDGYKVRCGLEFQPLSSLHRARIYDAIVHSDKPGIHAGIGTSFEQLWQFFLDTNFLYPGKLAGLDEPAVRATFKALLRERTPLAQFILFDQEGTTFGHVSALRAYTRTCLAQHLAARPGLKGVPLGRMLSMAMVQFQEYQPDIEWMKLFYRPNNDWPRIVNGSFARRTGDSVGVDHTTYDYLTLKLGASVEPDHPAIRLIEPDEERLLEAHFIARGRTAQMRADDFVAGYTALADIDRQYGALGLTRRREVLVYEEAGRLRGFAALEFSSIGMNLSDLTNSFRLLVDDPDPAVVRALAASAVRRYTEAGDARCIALAESDVSGLLQDMGFCREKEYAALIWHRSTFGHYTEHVHRTTAQDYA